MNNKKYTKKDDITNEDTFEPAEPDTEEMVSTLKDKFENFWYFYKWQTILGIIIAVGVLMALVQMSGNSQPDVAVLYVGPSYLTVKDKDNMAINAEQFMIDFDGDGEKTFHLLDINVVPVSADLSDYAMQVNREEQKRFTTEIAAGDSMIYILEESFYRQLIDLNILAKLGDVLDEDMIPENSEEYGVRIKELDFFTQQYFSSFGSDSYICMRSAPVEGALNYGRTPEYWNSNKIFFRSVFAYKAPAKN